MKRLRAISLILITGTTLTACASTERSTGSTEAQAAEASLYDELKKSVPKDIPDHIDMKISDVLTVDADVNVPKDLDKNEVSTIQSSLHIFADKEGIFDELLKLSDIGEIKEKGEKKNDDQLDDGTFITVLSGVAEDGVFLQVRDNRLIEYGRKDALTMFSFFTESSLTESDEYLTEPVDLDFMTINDTHTRLEAFLDKIGMPASVDTDTGIFTKEEIEELNRLTNEKYSFDTEWKNRTYTKDDEGYLIRYNQGYQGIRYYPYMNGTVSPRCEFAVTKDGLEYCEITDILEFDRELDKVEILPLGEILESYCTRENQLIESGAMTFVEKEVVRRIGLYYLPTYDHDLIYTARPVWCIFSDRGGEEDMVREVCVYDARTGEEIQSDE